MFSHLAASAYEDVEWINILVPWVADIATNRPHIKIIGEPKNMKSTQPTERSLLQGYVSAIKSLRELWVVNVY